MALARKAHSPAVAAAPAPGEAEAAEQVPVEAARPRLGAGARRPQALDRMPAEGAKPAVQAGAEDRPRQVPAQEAPEEVTEQDQAQQQE
ncbi:MAG: hypothetical protein R3191_05735 [Anaerolineales bacterium]|nr:hypothetical protein [Anaerolineales bacterium]